MSQDLSGGYCPKCNTVWASPGFCKCKIPYANTKEGIHETANKNGLKPWSLGCNCEECNKEFQELLD